MTCPKEFLAVAQTAADLAGGMLRERFRRPVRVEDKADGSPVTEVDRAVEAALRDLLRRRLPEQGVIGEEFPAEQAGAEFVWIIDPLDGTKDFLLGLPLFGCLIALAHQGEIVLGLADQPVTRDRWLGAAGHGTTLNGAPARTRACPTLAAAQASTMGYDTFCRQAAPHLQPLRRTCAGLVTADSFYVFGLLASGHVDLVASAGFALHDYAALDAIVRNAGGAMTDWQGQRLGLHSDGSVLAVGDAALLAPAMALLAGGTADGA